MARYAAIGWIADQPRERPSGLTVMSEDARTMQVIDVDAAPQPTGLLDHRGIKIYRMPERVTMGFRSK
jgi:hypothetical protein